MRGRLNVRDWEVNEAIFDMVYDSYDVVGRGFPIGGFEADFFRYRAENSLVEAGFLYGQDYSKEDAMEQLSGVREYLTDSPFCPTLFRQNAEISRPGYSVNLEGTYIIDPSSNEDVVVEELDKLLPEDIFVSDLSTITCNR